MIEEETAISQPQEKSKKRRKPKVVNEESAVDKSDVQDDTQAQADKKPSQKRPKTRRKPKVVQGEPGLDAISEAVPGHTQKDTNPKLKPKKRQKQKIPHDESKAHSESDRSMQVDTPATLEDTQDVFDHRHKSQNLFGVSEGPPPTDISSEGLYSDSKKAASSRDIANSQFF